MIEAALASEVKNDAGDKSSPGEVSGVFHEFLAGLTSSRKGIEQLNGINNTQTQGTNTETWGDKAAYVAGNAVQFLAVGWLSSKIPLIGRFGPAATGAALGYFQPVNPDAPDYTRFEHAAFGLLGMGTAGILGAAGRRAALNRYEDYAWAHPEKEMSSLGIHYALKQKLHSFVVRNNPDKVEIPSFKMGGFTAQPKAKVLRLNSNDTAAQIWQRYKDSAVRIRSEGSEYDMYGTGFAVARRSTDTETDLIATARHVAFDEKGNPADLIVDFADGSSGTGQIVKTHSEFSSIDTVLVRVPGAKLKPIPLGSVFDVTRDEPVYLLGHPDGTRLTFMSQGTIDKPTYRGNARGFEFDVPTIGGNSGGPLLNSKGEVVGLAADDIRDTKLVYIGRMSCWADGADHVTELL